jgi:SAM-dependent methyltransferase
MKTRKKKLQCYLCNSSETTIVDIGEIKVTKCKNCEFQYIKDSKEILGDEWFSGYYTKNRSDLNAELNSLRELQYKIDAKFLAQYINKNDLILDVGCSHGGFLSAISKIKKEINCLGIDVDKAAIETANKKFHSIAKFEEKKLTEIDSKKKFDLIIFRGTLQYLGDEMHESMEHIRLITKPDTKIVIFSLPSTDSFIYYLLQEHWPLFHPEMSLMFNENSVKYLAKKYKYKIERLEYPYINEIYSNRDSDFEKLKSMIEQKNYTDSVPFIGSVMRLVLSLENVN